MEALLPGVSEPKASDSPQRQFFDYAGPLFSVVVSPAASTTPLNETRKFRALPRDRSRRRVIEDLTFAWELIDGQGTLEGVTNQEAEYRAPAVPGLARLKATVTQREVTVTAEALITVTDSLESALPPAVINTRGLPGYTFERAAGELWRCRFDVERNIIVVNSGHRDFVFATRNRALAAALLGPALRQRAGTEEFRRITGRSVARAHDRAVPVCGREIEAGLMGAIRRFAILMRLDHVPTGRYDSSNETRNIRQSGG